GLAGVANLGDTTGAMESLERAVAIRTALARAAPNDLKAQAAFSVSQYLLAHILDLRGDNAGARRHGEEAVRIAEATFNAHPSEQEARIALIGALDALSDLFLADGSLERIIEIRRRGLQLEEELAAAAAGDSKRRRSMAIACKKLGAALEKS